MASRDPDSRLPIPASRLGGPRFPLYSIWLGAPILLVALLALAIALGSVPLSLGEVYSGLTGTASPEVTAIVRTLRLPRALLAVLVGAGLGMAGAALQGTLRNPLAEPYLLGVSGGAAVGAVIAVSFGLLAGGLLPLAAFAGALGAVTAALVVARAAGGGADPRVLLMAGVIIGAFANAAIMVALANAPPNTVRGALWWMMGSVSDADWTRLAWLAAYLAIAGALLVWRAREIDILALGEEPAAALGLDVDRSVMWIFVLASLLAAATVAAAGLIGFVGLVVPHLVRRAGVRRHRPLIVGSALTGGALVVAADIAARTAAPPAELPLGAITALIGVPFFLVQLARRR
jgi:iron complex transport system permease protein